MLNKKSFTKIPSLSLPLLSLLLLFSLSVQPVSAERAYHDDQGGGFWIGPENNTTEAWRNHAIYFGHKKFNEFVVMPPESIKGAHGRMQHFSLNSSETNAADAFFPGSRMVNYDAEEVTKGNRSLGVTRNGNPVYFDANYNNPDDFRLFDVDDERYIKFFITEYIRKGMHGSKAWSGDNANNQWGKIQNLWVGLDNCMFRYDHYDNPASGSGPWDEGYPQNATEFMYAINHFFSRVKAIAPDIRMVCNEGTHDFENQYEVYSGQLDGIIWEGASGYHGEVEHFDIFIRRLMGPNKDKIQVFQYPGSDNPDNLRRNFIRYLIATGENGFFGPSQSPGNAIPRSEYASMENALGAPVAPVILEPQNTHLRMYKRQTEGGWVFFNYTGNTQTINLGDTFYDMNGDAVTEITLANDSGAYVTNQAGERSAKPQINPRRSTLVTGPLTVTIDPGTSSGATIRYTTDGSNPTAASPIYSGPLVLNSSATVKARTFVDGKHPSFITTATYEITSQDPKVEFHLSNDYNSEYIDTAHPLFRLSHPSSKPVTVNFQVTGGTATEGQDYSMPTGSITFRPGEVYTYFPFSITNDGVEEGNETIILTLTSATNATLGSYTTFTYTIVDNDGAILLYPSPVEPNPLIDTKPSKPVLVSPIDDFVVVGNPAPVFTWKANPEPEQVTQYTLKVLDAQGKLKLSGKFPAASICDAVTCTVDSATLGSTSLGKGAFRWRVIADNGSAKNKSALETFSIEYPGKSTLISPIDKVVVNDVQPLFRFSKVEAAAQYRVKVISAGSVFVSPWLDAGAANCNGAECEVDFGSLTTPITLPKGAYTWRVITRNPAVVPGKSKSAAGAFSVMFPGVVNLVSPDADGTVDTLSPVFVWKDITNAAQYRIVIYNKANKVLKQTPWLDKTAAGCVAEANCTVDTSALATPITLKQKKYKWRVEARNKAVAPGKTKSERRSFTIDLP